MVNKKLELLYSHPEFKVVPLKRGLKDIADEAIEFIDDPSKDELSDIMFGIGRLVGGLIGKYYVRMPFDGIHIDKVYGRLVEYGHFRSKRHLSL